MFLLGSKEYKVVLNFGFNFYSHESEINNDQYNIFDKPDSFTPKNKEGNEEEVSVENNFSSLSGCSNDQSINPNVKFEFNYTEPVYDAAYKNKEYTCGICDMSFPTYEALKKHSNINHVTTGKKNICKGSLLIQKGKHNKNNRLTNCSFCGKFFISKNELLCHLRIHQVININHSTNHGFRKTLNKERKNKCSICDKTFPLRIYLSVHMRLHDTKQVYSQTKTFKCTICLKKFCLKSTLHRHMMWHTKKKMFRCRFCQKTFCFYSDLRNHVILHVQGKMYSCPICQRAFCGKGNVKIHLQRNHVQEKNNRCNVCSQIFNTNRKLVDHQISHAEIKKYKCSMCFKAFVDKKNLSTHEKTHNSLKKYKCAVCSERFPTKDHVDNHKQMKHFITENDAKFKCSLCGHICRDKKSLSLHMYLHTREKKFKCTNCIKSFVYKSHFDRHLSSQKHKWKICLKFFSAKESLRDHLVLQTGNKPFKCSHCRKAYVTKGQLKIHFRIHTGETFDCGICSKKFTRKTRLRSHLRIHSDKNPFRCSICLKSYPYECRLKRHMRVHTGERPFKCSTCFKTFGFSCSLKKHMNIHLNTKSKCSVCLKLLSVSSLQRHMKMHTTSIERK